MIAFIKPPEEPTRMPHLPRVRHLLADALFSPRRGDLRPAPPVVGWKAWLFAAWLAVAAIWGIVHTVGILLPRLLGGQ